MQRRLATALVAAATGVGAALGAAGCGEDRGGVEFEGGTGTGRTGTVETGTTGTTPTTPTSTEPTTTGP